MAWKKLDFPEPFRPTRKVDMQIRTHTNNVVMWTEIFRARLVSVAAKSLNYYSFYVHYTMMPKGEVDSKYSHPIKTI